MDRLDRASENDPSESASSHTGNPGGAGKESFEDMGIGGEKSCITPSSDDLDVLRTERDLLIGETRKLEEQLRQVQDELLSIERSFAGRLTSTTWRLLNWLFPIGSKRHLLGRRIWRSVKLWENRVGLIGARWRRMGKNRRWVRSGDLVLSKATYQKLLEDQKPINLEYRRFIKLVDPTPGELMQQVKDSEAWAHAPRLSIVTALHGEDLEEIESLVTSVQTQTFLMWQWWVVVPPSTGNEIHTYLRAVSRQDRRIIIRRGRSASQTVVNLNQAIESADGDFIVLLMDTDRLAPHALFTIAQTFERNSDTDYIYTDYDLLGLQGVRLDPLFKPDWSPEMMLSTNLMEPLAAFRKEVFDRVGHLDEAIGEAYLWDFCLRIAEHVELPRHIPMILCHRHLSEGLTKSEITSRMLRNDSERIAVLHHLRRRGLRLPRVEVTPVWRMRVSWDLKDTPLVSIIIPSKDQPDLLRRCVDTLISSTDYVNFEIIVVDTGSTDPQTLSMYDTYRETEKLQILGCEGEFNFSRTCNQCAAAARGEVLLFLNNDTEVLEPDWLRSMLQWFELDEIGAVGAKLIFPDGRIQHGGVIVGMGGIAAHLFLKEEENLASMFGSDQWYRNFWAVTAACMLVSREAFEDVRGFDEGYTINYSDVDFCLKLIRSGKRIVYTPDSRLLHHESVTHGKSIPRHDFECAAERWRGWGMLAGDPYYNQNLSYMSASPKFIFSKRDRPDHLCRDLLARLPNKEILKLPGDLKR